MNLRVDESLYARVAAAAEAEHRSINSYVAVVLDKVVPVDPAQQPLFTSESGAA